MRTLIRLGLCLGMLLALAVSSASAETYPDRPVKVIVPFAPAGLTDVIARIVTEKLTLRLGERFYVENRGGASGNIGTATVAAAEPDGHTLLFTASGLVVNPSLFANVPYDPVRDFAPISLVAVSPNVITVHPSVPARSIKELIGLIKANPGKYTYATAGHLSGQLFRTSQGLELAPVQFRSAGPALQSTLGGHTPIAITALAPATPLIKEGGLRALMVTSASRVRALPEVPTPAESGLAGLETYTFTGLLAPAATPRAIVNLLHREIAELMAEPAIQARLDELGYQVVASSPDAFAERIKTELAHWAKVLRDAKIRPEGTQ
ncbi:MAG TPA: tripartite tricarboxylate transporter substrate binding protein [Hyphomicrobiaceae bacterium]|nr:tripartite tricarboxylate transporter substrate binding protein [Hyphomicrobiaceae bacterium]